MSDKSEKIPVDYFVVSITRLNSSYRCVAKYNKIPDWLCILDQTGVIVPLARYSNLEDAKKRVERMKLLLKDFVGENWTDDYRISLKRLKSWEIILLIRNALPDSNDSLESAKAKYEKTQTDFLYSRGMINV